MSDFSPTWVYHQFMWKLWNAVCNINISYEFEKWPMSGCQVLTTNIIVFWYNSLLPESWLLLLNSWRCDSRANEIIIKLQAILNLSNEKNALTRRNNIKKAVLIYFIYWFHRFNDVPSLYIGQSHDFCVKIYQNVIFISKAKPQPLMWLLVQTLGKFIAWQV